MKKIIFIAIFFIFNLNIINSRAYLKSDFEELTNSITSNQQFIENGVKINFNTDLEEQQLINLVTKQYNLDNNCGYTHSFKYNNMTISYCIWNDEKTKLSIQIINSDKQVTIEQIITSTNEMFSDLVFDGVYKYSKYRLINKEEKDLFLDTKKISQIDIHNGSIEKRKLQDNTEVSIAHMKYSTGEYLILGTPVIFVTY